MAINNLEDALKKIDELEKQIEQMQEELDFYHSRKLSGRKKHNEKWQGIYNDFVASYEKGVSLAEIAKHNNVSVRTIYRYKEYYEKMKAQGNEN